MWLGVLKPYQKSAEYASYFRAKMGRFVSQHGTAAVVKKFIGELGCSKNEKLKCCKFSKLQKREIKMQRKISVLQ